MIKVIIFDLDGTLFMTKESYRIILAELIGKKYDINPEEVLKSYNYAETLMDNSKKYNTMDDFFKEFNYKFLKEINVNPNDENLNILQSLVTEMKERAPTELKMYPFVKETLRQLKNGNYKIALLTGSWDKNIEIFTDEYIQSKVKRVDKLLKNSKLIDLFDKIFIAYIDRILKPSPQAFQKVLDYFKITSNEALMIGDGEPDMKASEMGIRTILFNPNSNYSDNNIKPNYEFKDFSELPSIINNIN